MTLQDCIDYVDSIEPNAYTNAQKTGWLNEVEGKVYTQLFLVQPYEFKQTPQTLALPAPYDRMYSRYLQAMIHYANGEYDRYANSMAMFNEVWAEANRWFGGDFDVTDRLRNRRFEVEITQDIAGLRILDDVPIMDISEGCAIVAGRIYVKTPMTYQTFSYTLPSALPAGTYHFRLANGSVYFTTTADYTAGTVMEYANDTVEINHDEYSCSFGENGTLIDPLSPVGIAVNDQQIVTFLPMDKGITPLPMLMSDIAGAGIVLQKQIAGNYVNWIERGGGSQIYFTGRLLIPAEKWYYDDKYARRRDARWLG